MNYTIIYPSRSRPEICQKVINQWQETARKFEYHQWIIAVDEFDPMLDLYKQINFWGELRINNNRSCIDAINDAANSAYNDIFIVISDDFEPFLNWDIELWEVIHDKSDFLLKTNDGLQKTLVTLPIMDRKYYDRFGYIYNPEYKHMFVDQELTAVAIMIGKYIKISLIFNHLHYSIGKTKKDALNVRNDASWQSGEKLFNERLKINFGIDNPVVPYSSIQWC